MLELLQELLEETRQLLELMPVDLEVLWLNHSLQYLLSFILLLSQLQEGESGLVEVYLDEIVD
ncbi:hypothetical protein [Nostoc sp. PCC 9305]|uniref:hypothetical protein n=1 Tax=Nostoc sp. PCC 9305 TaxID=296636 RepID=UPI0039C63A38